MWEQENVRCARSCLRGDIQEELTRFEGLGPDYKRRLWVVIGINAVMFLVEMGAGALAGSRALQADALVAVMLAALGVWLTATRWPDLIVAALMAGVFVTYSVQMLRQAVGELRSVEATT